MWFSGKEMIRGKLLKDYVGKNEKTKIVAKLQKVNMYISLVLFGPQRGKTCLRGSPQSETKISLLSYID